MDANLLHRISTIHGKQYDIDAKYVYYEATINGYRLRYVYTLSRTYPLRQLVIDNELAHLLGFTSAVELRRLFRTNPQRTFITPKALKRKFM